MPNMSLKRNVMNVQDPNVRNKNFKEVALGYTPEQAIDEAKRCLNCRHKPCVSGCPVKIYIPEFIAKVAEGKFEEAYEIISKFEKPEKAFVSKQVSHFPCNCTETAVLVNGILMAANFRRKRLSETQTGKEYGKR